MPRAGRTPNVALYNLRDARAESQDQVADALNQLAAERNETTAITGNHVSRWERGVVYPSPLHRQLLAAHFGVTAAELGLARQRLAPAGSAGHVLGSPADLLTFDDGPAPAEDPAVVASRAEWLHVRRSLGSKYLPLARAAAQLYPPEVRCGDTGIIAHPDWQFSELVDLDDIQISYEPSTPPPTIDGTEDFTSHLRPFAAPGRRYQRYSYAIRDVARPKLFENRPSWRLTGADFTGTGGRLTFGDMNYFDAIDISEALAHETAARMLVNDGQVAAPSWRGLTFRKALGDPFDLARRSLILSINTLTIRKDKHGASMILHSRSADSVATSGGVIGVMPAGVFQPSTVRAGAHTNDFNLWRNIMREYSEEFLGNPEHAGDGPGADYTQEPLKSFDLARQAGDVRLYCTGIGVSALDLWGALETVAVIEGEAFDELFADLVSVNDEGRVVTTGSQLPSAQIPFSATVIEELCATGRVAPETAYSLRVAWKAREQLFTATVG